MTKTEFLTFDAVKLGIKNRISAGTESEGVIAFNGGLLLQGRHHGQLTLRSGALVVYEGAALSGKVVVHGDAWIRGEIGKGYDDSSELVVHGVLHLAAKSEAYGQLRCESAVCYDGCTVYGHLDTTLRPANADGS